MKLLKLEIILQNGQLNIKNFISLSKMQVLYLKQENKNNLYRPFTRITYLNPFNSKILDRAHVFQEVNELMSRFDTLYFNYTDLIHKAEENEESLKSLQKEHEHFAQVSHIFVCSQLECSIILQLVFRIKVLKQ